jgi:hypothetical protein
MLCPLARATLIEGITWDSVERATVYTQVFGGLLNGAPLNKGSIELKVLLIKELRGIRQGVVVAQEICIPNRLKEGSEEIFYRI